MEHPPHTPLLERLLATKTAAHAAHLMRSKYGVAALGTISFVESLLPLPIITDPFLVAAIMANRAKAWSLTLITTATSVLGGIAAYLYAVLLREIIVPYLPEELQTLLSTLVAGQPYDTFILTIIGAVTPVPYTVIAYAVAFTDGNPLVFILGSIVGRLFRYGVVGWCTYKFGPLALTYAKRSIVVTSIIIFILGALYIWLKM